MKYYSNIGGVTEQVSNVKVDVVLLGGVVAVTVVLQIAGYGGAGYDSIFALTSYYKFGEDGDTDAIDQDVIQSALRDGAAATFEAALTAGVITKEETSA